MDNEEVKVEDAEEMMDTTEVADTMEEATEEVAEESAE
jgi:hypothetical protein